MKLHSYYFCLGGIKVMNEISSDFTGQLFHKCVIHITQTSLLLGYHQKSTAIAAVFVVFFEGINDTTEFLFISIFYIL